MTDGPTLADRVDAELAAKGVSAKVRADIRRLYDLQDAARRFAKKSEARRL